MQAYEGYFDRGRFIPLGTISIPERKRAIVTILDEPVSDDAERRLEELDKLISLVDASSHEEVPQFERSKLHREAEL